MPWGGAGDENIEHRHTLVSEFSFFFCQVHFNFIGKMRFCPATSLIQKLESSQCEQVNYRDVCTQMICTTELVVLTLGHDLTQIQPCGKVHVQDRNQC